ncbi:sybindin-like family protein [Cryptosporidium serpentis]
MYYSLYINNKNGSLIYQKDFTDILLTANDRIRLASTFHGLCTIAKQLSPTKSPKQFNNMNSEGGINMIMTDLFRLECFETMTGLRFFIVASPSTQGIQIILKKVYETYTDYVLKNPFHDLDMPIRCSMFEKEINKIFS